MVDLREKLMIYMRSMGAPEISESTKKHFQRKLEKEFGDLLQFGDLLNNNRFFVLPKNLSKVQPCEETAFSMSKIHFNTNDEGTILQSNRNVRMTIQYK